MNGTGIIYMDDTTNASHALFGKPMESTQAYIASNIQRYTQALGGTANQFANFIQSRFNEVRSARNVALISNMRVALGTAWNTNSVRPLQTIEAIQVAPPVMQRWVMASPDLRQRYNNKALEAYDSQYVNLHPTGIAETHYDYRRVTDGIYMKKGDGYQCANYKEYIDNDDEDTLSLIEKMSVLLTWDTVHRAIESGDNRDPTSVWNGTL